MIKYANVFSILILNLTPNNYNSDWMDEEAKFGLKQSRANNEESSSCNQQ